VEGDPRTPRAPGPEGFNPTCYHLFVPVNPWRLFLRIFFRFFFDFLAKPP